MIKILNFSIIALSTVLFTGCDYFENDDKKEEVSKKHAIQIVQDVGTIGCTLIKEELKKKGDKITNLVVTSTSNDVSCKNYGKTAIVDRDVIEKEGGCIELTLADVQDLVPDQDISILEDKKKSCVIAFNLVTQ